jgi:hypothetical protein
LEDRKCCEEDILEKRGRALEREEERRRRGKTSNGERREEKGVGEWTGHRVAFKHSNIEGTS